MVQNSQLTNRSVVRYSKALYSISSDKSIQNKIFEESKELLSIFEKNESFEILLKSPLLNKKKQIICLGITAYPAKDAKIIAGAKSNEIENLLGYHSRDVIIHRDDMVLKN